MPVEAGLLGKNRLSLSYTSALASCHKSLVVGHTELKCGDRNAVSVFADELHLLQFNCMIEYSNSKLCVNVIT